MNRSVKAAAAVLALGAIAAMAWIAYACLVPVAKFNAPRVVVVNPGDSLGTIARRLASEGVIRSARAMIVYAELSGGGRNLKPGDYAFSGGERLDEVLHHLIVGDFVAVTVAIPEGATLHQI
ncbi:MAG: endolytic transglycosylase MltG, partial [Candidatus Binataceae bacterium]